MSKELRGTGRVYLQKYASGKFGKIWWIAYWAKGIRKDGSIGAVLHRETSHSMERSVAVRLLKQRVSQAATGRRAMGATAERLTLRELLDALAARYATDNRTSSLQMATRAQHHLCAHFGEFTKVLAITGAKLDEYKLARKRMLIPRSRFIGGELVKVPTPPASGSINRELAMLRSAYHLAVADGLLSRDHVPVIRLLSEVGTARQGFVEPSTFEAMLVELPVDLRDPVRFLYATGWRCGSMRTLEWRDLELEFADAGRHEIKGGRINLRAENAKTRRSQALPLFGEVLAIIRRAWVRHDLACPYVFHRDGAQIRSFRRSWQRACKAIGQPALMVHDLRRSAIRNMTRAGIGETVAMSISGHTTNATFKRYNISAEADLANALVAVDRYHQERLGEGLKVVPITRRSG